jgi:hypothetical protein
MPAETTKMVSALNLLFWRLLKFVVDSQSQGDQGSMLWSQFSAIFLNFRRKNWRFYQKPMLWSTFFKIWLCFASKTPIYRRIFWRKYFKNHNIGPRLGEFSPIVPLFTLGSFLKITEAAYIIFWLLYPTKKVVY